MLGELSAADFSRVRIVSSFTLSCAAAITLWLCPLSAAAQAAYFSGVTNALPGTYTNPTAVAVDTSGNIYVSDRTSGTLTEISASNSTTSVLASGLNDPFAVALDSKGNIYFANNAHEVAGSGTVQMIPVGGGSPITLASGFDGPEGLAVDRSGNVYFADNGDSNVDEIPASVVAGIVAGSIVAVTPSNVTELGGGFSGPEGLAVDQSYNLYVADVDNGAIKELQNSCLNSSCVATLVSSLSTPEGVTVDQGGDVFYSTVGTNSLQVILSVNGVIPESPTILTLGSGFSHPIGLAQDGKGDVFVANYGAGSVLDISTNGVNFGSINIGTASPPSVAVPFTFTSTETLNAPVVLTGGATSKDFTQTATTCSGTISVGNSCTVTVQFAPAAPGLRLGAVQLEDSSGNLLATANIYGTGIGPQVAFPSNSDPSVIGSGFSLPNGLAVDGSGDVFVADAANNAVKEIVAVGGQVSSTSTVNTVASGFKNPAGVAVDGSGDVFVADNGNGAVKEIVAVNGQVSSASSVNTVGSGFSSPFGVAVDGSGDVFVGDSGGGTVKEIVAESGQVSSSSTVNTIDSGFNAPRGVAVDGDGDVFLADNGNNAVKEIVAVNGQVSSSSTVNTIGSGFSAPSGVAVDAAGDVFVADTVNNAVEEIVAVGGHVSSTSTVVPLGWGFSLPAGVALDASGDVFVADSNFDGESNSAVTEMPLATPPALDFSATEEGTTDTTDGPLAATIANNGNATLTFNLPTTGDNPNLSTSNFTWDDTASTCTQTSPDSSTAFTLAEGASCTLGVDFTPTALGVLADNLSLADNTLNAASATQQIPLSGFAAVAAAITSPTNGSTLTGASTTFTWSAGAGGVAGYYLHIGTTSGGSNLVNIGPLSGTSATVSLPTNGTTIYAQLQTSFSDGSVLLSSINNYTEFTVSAGAITSPTNSSTLTGASTTFTWSAGAGGVAGYYLHIGTTSGGSNLVNIGPLSGTSATVSLPTNGTTIYAQLQTSFSDGSFLLSNINNYTEFTQ